MYGKCDLAYEGEDLVARRNPCLSVSWAAIVPGSFTNTNAIPIRLHSAKRSISLESDSDYRISNSITRSLAWRSPRSPWCPWCPSTPAVFPPTGLSALSRRLQCQLLLKHGPLCLRLVEKISVDADLVAKVLDASLAHVYPLGALPLSSNTRLGAALSARVLQNGVL